MYSILKALCLATYLLAIASFANAVPAVAVLPLQLFAATLLAAHALEAVIFMRYVRLYRGSLLASLLLTLLFGLLHWKPLADAKAGKLAN